MIEILKRMFEANPEKSTITINDKCSNCGCETILEITPTSGGFGIQGGVLYKSSNDNFIVTCPACIGATPKIHDNSRLKSNIKR
jgi:hypothetical protein